MPDQVKSSRPFFSLSFLGNIKRLEPSTIPTNTYSHQELSLENITSLHLPTVIKHNEWVSEWVSKVQHPIRHFTGHFGEEFFQAVDCTGTDNQKQGNKTLHTQNKNRKTALSNRTTYSLVWYPFMTSGQEIWMGPIFTTPEPHIRHTMNGHARHIHNTKQGILYT